MLVPDRHRRVLDAIRRSGSVEVAELASALKVSSSTVRRDLAQLEAEGQLLRTRGGAYVPRGAAAGRATGDAGPADNARPADDAGPAGDPVKQRIGRAAAGRIVEASTVMILEGSTTRAMLPHLQGRQISVVTNSLRVAAALQHYLTVSVVMLGGLLDRRHMTFLGPMSEQSMANLHVDAIYAGAWGITPEIGVTGDKIVQAGYHHSALRHSQSLTVLADASKFGRIGPTQLAAPEQISCLITDDATPAETVSALRARGVEVVVC